MLREDTVVSSFPPSFDRDRDREETNHARPRGRFVESRTDAAIAAIGRSVPPQPKGWGAPPVPPTSARLRVVEPPRTMNDVPVVPPCPPVARPLVPRQAASPAAGAIQPIPDAVFEPSVVASVPRPPVRTAAVEAIPSAAAETDTAGKVIVLFSCRGGAGATTLAVNTAANLARAGHSVCVVDLDLQLGDVFVALDLQPTTSIASLAREAGTIDAAALKRRLARHDSGVYALSQTGHVDDVDPALVERMPALMATLASHFDYVIVDGVRDFGDCALAALDMADQVAMVMAQDVASVRRAARAVTLFRRLGYSESKLRLVLNRTQRKARVGEPEIVTALGLRIDARIRNDFRRAAAALDDGALLGDVARGSGLSKDLDRLTRLFGGPQQRIETAPIAKQRRRLFGLFGKGGK